MALKRPILTSRMINGGKSGIPTAGVNVLGVKIADVDEKSAVLLILKLAKDGKNGHYVVTANSEFVMLARKNPEFSKILADADLAVADSVGVVIAKLIYGGKYQNRITGVDLLEKLCAKSAKLALRIGFLGGFSDIANKVAERQIAKYPGLRVVFADPGNPTMSYDLRLKRALDKAGRIDILFVAFGMGQQEFWIKRNKNRLNIGVFIGVGGAFDYISQLKRRAPRVIQKSGLEWFWRLIWEPARIWRMRVLPLFLFLVIRQYFTNKIKPHNYK